MKKYLCRYISFFSYLIVAFVFLFVIVSGNNKNMVVINNLNNSKSVMATNISQVIDSNKKETYVFYNDFSTAVANASTSVVSFNGKLTSYGPDCVGCGGNSACKPRQNFKNGNIYFDDSTYGKIRVVAADKSIPCGSVVSINNLSDEVIYAVVMDRGSAIKGSHFDLLFSSEKEATVFGTHSNVNFNIMRWGF